MKQKPNTQEQQLDGDLQFWGVDQRGSGRLPAGLLHNAENLRMPEGRPETRKGVVKPGWANKLALGTDLVSPFGNPYGLGVFRHPDSLVEWLLVAADGFVWRSRPCNQGVTVPLPTAVKILGPCTFVQAFNKIYLFRGRAFAPLRMSSLDIGFEDLLPHWDASTSFLNAAEVAYGPFAAVTSITRVGNLATVVTAAPHGYVTGADVTITGAVQTAYNGRKSITTLDAVTFTFQVFGAPATPATGTIKVSNMIQYWRAGKTLWTLTSVTRVSNTATAHKTAHGFSNGDNVTIAGANEAEFNNSFVITNVAADTFDFTVSGTTALPVASITRASTTATVTRNGHGFSNGDSVTIAGANESDYNGTFTISNVTTNTFDYTVGGTPASPATGTITVVNHSRATGTITATNNTRVIAGQSPDSNAAFWTRIYNILPNADTALYVNNRLLVPTAYEPSSTDNYATFNGGLYKKTDYIVATDYLDELHFDFADEFRINQGSADEIVDLAKFNEDTVVVWKNSSWAVLSNVSLDLTQLTLDIRSTAYGLSAPRAWAAAGADLCFVASKRGVVSIRQSEQGKLISVDLPLSAPLQPTIDRINWSLGGNRPGRVGSIRLSNWQNFLYVAAPLDAGEQLGPDLVAAGNVVNQASNLFLYVNNVVPGEDYLLKLGNCDTLSTALTYVPASDRWIASGTVLNKSGRFTATQDTYYLLGTIPGQTATVRQVIGNGNSAMLIRDFVAAARLAAALGDSTQGWSGLDTGVVMTVLEFAKMQIDGVERLLFLDCAGYVNLMEEMDEGDQSSSLATDTGLTIESINSRARGRNLVERADGLRQPVQLAITIQTWHPKYSITIYFGDGKKDVLLRVVDQVRSAVKYFKPWDKPDYDPSNVNDDWDSPNREDYSVQLNTSGLNLESGVGLLQFQEYLHTVTTRGQHGRTAQAEITCTQGRLKLLAMHLQAVDDRKRPGILG